MSPRQKHLEAKLVFFRMFELRNDWYSHLNFNLIKLKILKRNSKPFPELFKSGIRWKTLVQNNVASYVSRKIVFLHHKTLPYSTARNYICTSRTPQRNREKSASNVFPQDMCWTKIYSVSFSELCTIFGYKNKFPNSAYLRYSTKIITLRKDSFTLSFHVSCREHTALCY